MSIHETSDGNSRAKTAGLMAAWVLGASALHLLLWFVVLGYFYYYVPRQMSLFNDFGVELPETAILVIQLSDLIVSYWYLVLPATVLAVVVMNTAVVVLTRSRGWRLALIVLLLIPPVIWLVNCHLILKAPFDHLMQELH